MFCAPSTHTVKVTTQLVFLVQLIEHSDTTLENADKTDYSVQQTVTVT